MIRKDCGGGARMVSVPDLSDTLTDLTLVGGRSDASLWAAVIHKDYLFRSVKMPPPIRCTVGPTAHDLSDVGQVAHDLSRVSTVLFMFFSGIDRMLPGRLP